MMMFILIAKSGKISNEFFKPSPGNVEMFYSMLAFQHPDIRLSRKHMKEKLTKTKPNLQGCSLHATQTFSVIIRTKEKRSNLRAMSFIFISSISRKQVVYLLSVYVPRSAFLKDIHALILRRNMLFLNFQGNSTML